MKNKPRNSELSEKNYFRKQKTHKNKHKQNKNTNEKSIIANNHNNNKK